MSKREHKFYACVHEPCSFKTDKRKAIYTHLVRTHNERKEDYECEYCSSMFELDSEIERHLHVHHPQQPFTYTCVSRIEKVINTCAKLGSDLKHPQTPVKSSEGEFSSQAEVASEKKTPPKVENASPISKPPYLKPNISTRTRASVNASLNNIAKLPKFSQAEEEMMSASSQTHERSIAEEEGFDDNDDDDDEVEIETDDDTPTYISKPSGLKIKLSLKKGTDGTFRDVSSERSNSPPLLEPNNEEETDQSELPDDTPPDIIRTHPVMGTAQVRVKDSKYYDKLEVYHHTDEFGRRCCPFCDYKTSKNTIRVHLSGIHKIHFVKCSLCDYKAAFPHQITQHGIKFHKTTNLNVIQLSKESRDKTIGQLKKGGNVTLAIASSANESMKNNNSAINTGTGNEIIDDEDFNSEESYPTSADENESSTGQADDRIFRPPKCQTSKTDYYSIRIENGVYLYSCNLCAFQTPVRATIYTHKYRHEEKSYRCGYCDFTSAPRSNVVHHCRVKHKGYPVNVVENDADDSTTRDVKEPETKGAVQTMTENIVVKTEPKDADSFMEPGNASANVTSENTRDNKKLDQPHEKPHQTIIKVPQFKRSITSVSHDTGRKSAEIKRPKIEQDVPGVVPDVEYKLSLNKLYRINPTGSPKFMCAMCSYACDTHPKMKHHLYRHRPQKYKCPYCDHRKYPRSYVVRHVRDTHRNKPVRVIDLSKGNEPEDIPEYMNDTVADDTLDDTTEHIDPDEATSMNQTTVKQETEVETTHGITDDITGNTDAADNNTEQNEEVNALKNFAQKLNLRSVLTTDLNDDIFMQSSDVSANFNDYTSSPLIESFISGQYQNTSTPKLNTKNFDKKKSLKDYRVNYGQGPRYICNKCGYGTENYKTIHNHMYRHESQRYQCPYCGYRRSPKSFVENHIREVHKGHPVIVTELTIDQEMTDAPIGSPRQCVTLKRKDPQEVSSTPTDSSAPSKVQKLEENVATKVPVKWPAPKPVSQINTSRPQFPVSPILTEISDVSNVENDTQLSSPVVQLMQHDVKINSPVLTPVAITNPSTLASPVINPGRFVERNRTTFKTMYKCVFDPETCNHISKDKSKMKQHLFMHVEYKPWTCDFCEMTASQSSHIKNHVRTEHPGVSETSFKYKRHNYLEKHIEGFLTKGLFTVPVNEYRAIMDMKGNTKSSKQPTFDRDEEGNLLCPYCNYKTKSGGMTDHVKMKHMQPRFKCHWCDYRAFYRSEVRKHHRKEKSHTGLEFKTQELDLVQVMEGFKEKNGEASGTDVDHSNYIEPSKYLDDDEEDDDDDEDRNSECSSSEGSSLGDYQQGYVEYTTEQLSELCSNRQTKVDLNAVSAKDIDVPLDAANKQVLLGALNTEVTPDGSMKIVQKNENIKEGTVDTVKQSKFKCGYCSFSADLRVKVKMHCSKKHTGKVLKIVDPPAKPEPILRQDNLDLDADDWKGTKFEQDLRKAGVSKLNLASLFPHSKRFHQSDINYAQENEKLEKPCENEEFKKPLEPISKVKAFDRKIEERDITYVNENKSGSKCGLNEETVELSDETPKLEVNNAKSSIMICDVRSLKQDDENKAVCNEIDEEQEQTEESTKSSVTDKLKTAFPNHTTVILEDEEDNELMNELDNECIDGDLRKTDEPADIDTGKTEHIVKHCDTNQNNTSSLNDISQENVGEKNANSDEIIEDKNRSKAENIVVDKKQVNDKSEQKKDEPLKLLGVPLTNGHTFAIDGTLIENDELEINDKKSNLTTQSSRLKLDGTSDTEMDKLEIGEHDSFKTSQVIDLPKSNGGVCAMKDICEKIQEYHH